MTAHSAGFARRSRCIACGSPRHEVVASGRYASEPLAGFIARDPWGVDPTPFLAEADWSLCRCTDCGQMFHGLVLDEAWNERRFGEWMSAAAIGAFEERSGIRTFGARFDHAAAWHRHVFRLELLTRGIRGRDPVRLLDFGTGFGEFVEICRTYAFDAVGVDRSSVRIGDARVPVHASLDEVDGMFHAVTLFEVLEHLDSPGEVLDALARRMVPDAVLVLETPDCTGVTGIDTERAYRLVHPLDHINAFTPRTLSAIAARHGFRPIERPPATTTADRVRAGKDFAGAMLRRSRNTTQQYFRRAA